MPDITPDYGRRGPFAVGIMTLLLPGDRPVDVWYPAAPPASVAGDEALAGAFPNAAASGDGPFPIVLESHGFGSSRRDETFSHAHFASWGFVVVAPEHFERSREGLFAGRDFEELSNTEVLSHALDLTIAEANSPTSLLAGIVNSELVAVAGLSAGGGAALEFGSDPRVSAIIGRAPAVFDVLETLPKAPILIIASDRDILIPLASLELLYAQSAQPRRLAVLLNAGHNSFTDACVAIRAAGGLDTAQISQATGLPEVLIEAGNNGCTDEYVDPELIRPLVLHLQLAHLRLALGLDAEASALDRAYIEERYPGLLADYRTDP